MANKTLYPFGVGGQTPSGIEIVDDLTTGGSNKALSAEQGKELAQYVFMGSGKWGLGSDVETPVDATTRSNIIIGFTSTGISMTIGNQTISRDRANSNHTNNVYLFGSNNNQFLFMGKIYSARCTSGGSFNGVPAQRISDGKRGIYDLANSVFYPLT